MHIKPVRKQNVSQDLVNEYIPNGQFLIIDEEGNKLGIFERRQALEIASDHGFDILVVSPESKPMVAKLLDYSKYRYEQQKKQREMKKNQHVVQIKEIRLSPTIDKHDFETKVKNAIKFLAGGDKVKVSLRFRGRMITHQSIGLEVVNRFVESLGEMTIEAKPKLEGNTIIAVVAPIATK